MTEVCALRGEVYAYFMEDGSERKKAEGTKKCIIKREIMFENYKKSLFDGKIISKSQQIFRSDYHNVHTEEVNKIALSSRITTYPYGMNEMLAKDKPIAMYY